MQDLNCIHADRGLCPACQREYDADPVAYLEYGDHPAGLANLATLQAELDAYQRAYTRLEPDPDLPL